MPIVTKEKTQGEGKPLPSAKLNLYIFYGNGVIWDKAKNKALCRFEDGKLLTNDIRIISILVKRRFKYKTKKPIAKEILNKSYKAYKNEIKRNEYQVKADDKKLNEQKFDRKKLNNLRVSELKALMKAKKLRFTQITPKQEMVNLLLGARR